MLFRSNFKPPNFAHAAYCRDISCHYSPGQTFPRKITLDRPSLLEVKINYPTPPCAGCILVPMSRELISQLYEDTALWLWPYLWLEIIRIQRFINALPDADDPRVLYEIRQTQWGSLRLIQLTHDFGPSPFAWMNTPKITGESLCAEYIPAWLTQSPHLRRRPESPASAFMRQVQTLLSTRLRPTPEMRNLGMKSIYLDPG